MRAPVAAMAERPEDLNLPNAVITRIIKEAVSSFGGRMGQGPDERAAEEAGPGPAALFTHVLFPAPGRCQHLQGGPQRHLPRRQRLRAVRHFLVRQAELART